MPRLGCRVNDRVATPDVGASASASTPAREADINARDVAKPQERLASAGEELEELRASLHSANAREQLLRHELQHRVRNMLAVIRSILRRTRESGASQDEFAEHFEGRLNTIARYQSILSGGGSSSIELEDIVRNELLEVGCSDGPMCTIVGPPVRLGGQAVELISLAVHELVTNSVKFGALAHDGKMHIGWSVDTSSAEAGVRLRWTETGVSVIATAPRAQGFGRRLIEGALPYQLGAVTSFELRPGGLDCTIMLPLANLPANPEIASDLAADDSPHPPF